MPHPVTEFIDPTASAQKIRKWLTIFALFTLFSYNIIQTLPESPQLLSTYPFSHLPLRGIFTFFFLYLFSYQPTIYINILLGITSILLLRALLDFILLKDEVNFSVFFKTIKKRCMYRKLLEYLVDSKTRKFNPMFDLLYLFRTSQLDDRDFEVIVYQTAKAAESVDLRTYLHKLLRFIENYPFEHFFDSISNEDEQHDSIPEEKFETKFPSFKEVLDHLSLQDFVLTRTAIESEIDQLTTEALLELRTAILGHIGKFIPIGLALFAILYTF